MQQETHKNNVKEEPHKDKKAHKEHKDEAHMKHKAEAHKEHKDEAHMNYKAEAHKIHKEKDHKNGDHDSNAMYANNHPSFLSPERSELGNEEYHESDPPMNQMKYLYSALNRISSEKSDVKKQLSMMETTMLQMKEMLFGEETKGKGRVESSSSQPPMTISRSGDERFESMIKPRSDVFHFANREKMLKKIDMSMFDCENAYEWIVLVERLFRIGRYSEDDVGDGGFESICDMHEGTQRREHIATVMRMESSFFCKGMSEVSHVESKGSRSSYFLPLRTSSHYNSHRTYHHNEKKALEMGE
ncbi:unnamed protein product [Cochlearia groenlandica]